MYIIAGLGNPGSKYENTRHNIGWLALDELARQQGVSVDRMKFHALTAQCVLNGEKVLLMKPTTYMNNSGEAIEEARSFYKIPTGNVIVISDDITQVPAKIRIRKKGSAGGHNGLKDIIAHLGSDAFPRIRIGVGEKPHPDYDLAAWVLSDFSREEEERLSRAFPVINDGIRRILSGDFDGAQQTCNSFDPARTGTEERA